MATTGMIVTMSALRFINLSSAESRQDVTAFHAPGGGSGKGRGVAC
jgi:hypothetical protein